MDGLVVFFKVMIDPAAEAEFSGRAPAAATLSAGPGLRPARGGGAADRDRPGGGMRRGGGGVGGGGGSRLMSFGELQKQDPTVRAGGG